MEAKSKHGPEHVKRALDFHERWNKLAGLDGIPSEPELTRQYIDFLAREIAAIEAGTDAWNRAISACIDELYKMQREDCARLAKRCLRLMKKTTERRSTDR